MQLLRSCLALFQGPGGISAPQAFHNFTRRRLYRQSQRNPWKRRKRSSPAGRF